ncbi:enoyl-CoA hydratase [Rhizoctonia solani AG-1 IA]|uniref:Enoyl-CoA hydratase n=1 Tax=Thanatephorus cucumeris (strain AG1-IA) TaxID=983506 RepID=L8X4B2_THACA|nr:enoyl-CoA hydratase [Rhizoctonia solani AG-1 IA]
MVVRPSSPPPSCCYLEQVGGLSGVYSIVLNRPRARNALSIQMVNELADALDQVMHDRLIQVLIIRSSSHTAFCAGADLIERRTMSEEQVEAFLMNLNRLLSRLDSFPIPTIAAIDGPALGGGLELALTCDFRIAGSNVTKIGFPEVKLGIIPGAGGTQRAPRVIGLTRAKEAVFTGRMLSAQVAKEWGGYQHPSTAYDRALELAAEMAGSAPLALRAAKASISLALEVPLDAGLEHERACYEPLLSTRDRTEALDAFREKRQPVFRGE